MNGTPERSQLTTIALAAASVMLALFATVLILVATTSSGSQSPIAGDPQLYGTIATSILDGGIPYLDVTVEHLPGALVPMLFVGSIARITGAAFPALWVVAMSASFVISATIANTIPAGFDTGRRYLVLSLPLLPLVLFRVEPWLMLWVVAGIGLAFQSSWRGSSFATAVASLIKGWPIILLALPFRSGRRQVALLTGLGTVLVLIGISLLPGFQEGRAFEGIHTETLAGSVLLVFRGLAGANPQLIGAAGAAYVAAGTFAVILNLIIGLPFILLGIRALARTQGVEAQTVAIGLAVLGIILASPLFSAQFVFWLVPFVLFLKLVHRSLYIVASVMTLASVIWWEPTELAWSLLVLGRNGLLIALAILWALSLRRTPSDLEHVA